MEIISVPIIVLLVYWIINLIKYTTNYNEKFMRFIPLTATLLGIILGIITFYAMPEIIPAENLFMAIILGAASGLSATGTNQIIKQLGKGGNVQTKEKENIKPENKKEK